MTRYWLERAILPIGVAERVLVEERGGAIVDVAIGADPGRADAVLHGVAMPGFANAHSHAFHRALRGRTHHDDGSFWTWRDLMYATAASLDPARYERLATAVFAELVAGGWTAVGEFHYLHAPIGMDDAVLRAAEAAGIRLTLLDTLYLRGGLDDDGQALPLDAAQRAFADDGVDGWARRHSALAARVSTGSAGRIRLGAAIHSLRAVAPEDARALARDLAEMSAAAGSSIPLHAHVSEQPRENAQVLAAAGLTPVAALAEAGVLSPSFTAVHATHLTDDDIRLLADSGAGVCLCPTTERDLADGVGPARALADAGVPLSVGSDQNAVADPFAELQSLEYDARAASGRRGRFSPSALLDIGTRHGYRALGWQSGALEVGAACDLVVVDPRTARTAGAEADQLVLVATAADVTDVVVAGERIVTAGRHRLGDVGGLLADAIAELDAARSARMPA